MSLLRTLQGMEAMLRSALQSSPPDLVSQLNYILEQLNCDTSGDMSASDADDDEDDDGEDEEEEVSLFCAVARVVFTMSTVTFDLQDDPDVIDGDEGEVDPLVYSGGLYGEMLLSNRYLGVMTSATLPASELVQRVSVVGFVGGGGACGTRDRFGWRVPDHALLQGTVVRVLVVTDSCQCLSFPPHYLTGEGRAACLQCTSLATHYATDLWEQDGCATTCQSAP